MHTDKKLKITGKLMEKLFDMNGEDIMVKLYEASPKIEENKYDPNEVYTFNITFRHNSDVNLDEELKRVLDRLNK